MHAPSHVCRLSSAVLIALLVAVAPGSAETLTNALARAYAANPQLNAGRAVVRVRDEAVSIAQAGYRPTVSVQADIGVQRTDAEFSRASIHQTTLPGGAGLNVTQTLFNGFRTDNQTRQAMSGVLGERETLRATELTVLFGAVQAYMSVLSSTAVLELNRNNVEVLVEQLRQTRDRFRFGEVTRTDVAQAEARLAGARAQASASESQLRSAIGIYRQVIGVEPRDLAPGRPLDRFVPPSLEAALDLGLREHPEILSGFHAVDAAELQVKVAESALYPQASLQGSVNQRYDQQYANSNALSASIVGRLSIPIYEGGLAYSQVRQAKEAVGQARLQAETVRDRIRARIVDVWGRLEAAKAQMIAAQAQVRANEVALEGVREEARVGQRTTLDVLNAQQELLNARLSFILAQRDRVVFSYGVLEATGRLTARFIALPTTLYSADVHLDQVKHLWAGLRTPDGR